VVSATVSDNIDLFRTAEKEHGPLSSWDVSTVKQILTSLHVPAQAVDKLSEAGIDGSTLMSLTDEDLSDMGVEVEAFVSLCDGIMCVLVCLCYFCSMRSGPPVMCVYGASLSSCVSHLAACDPDRTVTAGRCDEMSDYHQGFERSLGAHL
jgi:hypothetical protein